MSVYRDMARDAGCITEDEIQQMAMIIEADHMRSMAEEQDAREEELIEEYDKHADTPDPKEDV